MKKIEQKQKKLVFKNDKICLVPKLSLTWRYNELIIRVAITTESQVTEKSGRIFITLGILR